MNLTYRLFARSYIRPAANLLVGKSNFSSPSSIVLKIIPTIESEFRNIDSLEAELRNPFKIKIDATLQLSFDEIFYSNMNI